MADEQDNVTNQDNTDAGTDSKGADNTDAGTDSKDTKDVKDNQTTPPADMDDEPSLLSTDSGGGEEDDILKDVAPEERELIDKVVEAKTKPIENRLFQQVVNSEINNYLNNNPEAKQYEARIKKWVNHPNRKSLIMKGLPVKTVIVEALAPYLQKIGAEKARKANEEANQTATPGSSPKATEAKGPDFSNMSPEEITRTAELVKSGRYKLE